MRIVCVGAGPAGLCAAAALKRLRPRWSVSVVERGGPDEVTGFGVVLPEAALAALERIDPSLARELAPRLWRWSDLQVVTAERAIDAAGPPLGAIDRGELVARLCVRCEALGVELHWGEPVIDIDGAMAGADVLIGADGAFSRVRGHFAGELEPRVRYGKNRFIWLGTTLPLRAFTFIVRRTEHGAFCIHAYRYRRDASTFIAECSASTWRRAGLDRASESETLAYLESRFSGELGGHRLISRRSAWRAFATVSAKRWFTDRAVLVGDAAHATHFSVGSGTRLAIDDAAALAEALADEGEAAAAFERYERARRPHVERLGRAARASQHALERLDETCDAPPGLLAFRLLARSGRKPHLRGTGS